MLASKNFNYVENLNFESKITWYSEYVIKLSFPLIWKSITFICDIIVQKASENNVNGPSKL